MTSNNFHHPPLQVQRGKLRQALHFVDFLLALVFSLGFTLLWPTTFPLLMTGVWVLFAFVVDIAVRRPGVPRAMPLEPYANAAVQPLFTALLFVLFMLLEAETIPWVHLAGLTLLCSAGMAVNRLWFRRRTPPLRIALPGSVSSDWEQQNRVILLSDQRPETIDFAEVDALLIDFNAAISPDWLNIIQHAKASGVPIWSSAELREDLYGLVSTEYLQTRHTRREEFHAGYEALKRLLDVLVTLILALPLLLAGLLVTLIVLVDMGRPVLFWQRRVGQDGKPFQLVKFRTMRRDSEQAGAQFAQQGDSRVTPVGQVLRKFRLDELPQFWNVLRGEMSIIGPRPEQESFVQRFNDELHLYAVRHWVKPGITGWAQVMQGYAASDDETATKLRYDLYYIKHYSFWLDARIVVKTIWTILTGFGAR